MSVQKGDRWVANPDERPKSRLFIQVNRVAKDGTWADISVMTWAVLWRKRQKLSPDGCLPMARPGEWDRRDLDEQEEDHMAWLREEGIVA